MPHVLPNDATRRRAEQQHCEHQLPGTVERDGEAWEAKLEPSVSGEHLFVIGGSDPTFLHTTKLSAHSATAHRLTVFNVH